jgi:hypothetical protein
MSEWKTTIRVSAREAKVLVTDEQGDELLRARLPRRVDHPRALLTVLEGLALWSGSPLYTVLSVGGPARGTYDRDLFGGVLWPIDSALVRVHVLDERPRRRIRGLGGFQEVLLLHGSVR